MRQGKRGRDHALQQHGRALFIFRRKVSVSLRHTDIRMTQELRHRIQRYPHLRIPFFRPGAVRGVFFPKKWSSGKSSRPWLSLNISFGRLPRQMTLFPPVESCKAMRFSQERHSLKSVENWQSVLQTCEDENISFITELQNQLDYLNKAVVYAAPSRLNRTCSIASMKAQAQRLYVDRSQKARYIQVSAHGTENLTFLA